MVLVANIMLPFTILPTLPEVSFSFMSEKYFEQLDLSLPIIAVELGLGSILASVEYWSSDSQFLVIFTGINIKKKYKQNRMDFGKMIYV